jgi:hypothetical protein
MKRLTRTVAVLFSGMLVVLVCNAGTDCDETGAAGAGQVPCANAAEDGAASLPKEAQDQVDELKVKMRYFKAIGFHKQSGEARDQIVEIYEHNGVPVPDEYKE